MSKRPSGPPGGHPGAGAPLATGIPPHPLTLDGAAVLHQMFRMRWTRWRALPAERRTEVISEAQMALGAMERGGPGGGSALFSMLGHKGDLLLVHFRSDLEQVHRAELKFSALALAEYLEPTTSYVSIVELGLYDSSVKLYEELERDGIPMRSDEWVRRVRARMAEQAAAMAPRLNAAMPPHKYLCFYPMDKKRGEQVNWYTRPIKERLKMMREHGLIGRSYAGRVKQIISGSIGFDDWEWGVDLFADDPLVFKELIYEMRFDEASAAYAAFGTFYISLRLPAAQLGRWLESESPRFGAA